MMRSFADIPEEIRRRLRAGERVALILLDGLGLELLHRHDGHPLLRRLAITPLHSQFPSTTTAHVTTAHFGVPVTEHGLYEWNVLEPSLDQIICPLRFTLASSEAPDDLSGRLDPGVLAPGPTFYETLALPCTVLQPRAIASSTYSRLATRGASRHGFGTLADGLRMLGDALAQPGTAGSGAPAYAGSGAPAYAMLYWDAIDRAGHEHGPDSPQFDIAARAALDALWSELSRAGGLGDATVLITADHGQVQVSPERVDYLDDLWPELPGLLSQARPAGSSRDAFLHVHPEHVDAVITGVAERLGDGARVLPAAELFTTIGPRLRERLGDVVVLAAPGRQVWLRSAAANERWFRGHHGGLEPAEMGTYLAEVTP